MNYFLVHFDFTTAHSGSRLVGRNGKATINSELSLEEMQKDEDLTKFCKQAIRSKNPKWKIFMLDITKIELIKP